MIKLLKEAILEKDWNKAIKAYENLTGEILLNNSKQGKEDKDEENAAVLPAPASSEESSAPSLPAPPSLLMPTEEDIALYGNEEEEESSYDEDEDDDIEDIEPPKRRKHSDEDDEEIIDIDDEEAADQVRCHRVPFDKSKKKNTWVDKKTIAMQDIEFDKKVRSEKSLANRNIERRPKPKRVRVTCHICHKKHVLLDSSLAPAVIGRKHGGERSLYTCDKCISRKRGRD